PTTGEIPLNKPELLVRTAVDAVRDGFRKRCPNCHKGKLFSTYFNMCAKCPNCAVNLEPEQGSYVGAMYINLILTEAIFIVGYLLMDLTLSPSMWTEIGIWVSFNLLFPIYFYPRSKGLWASVLYLCGDLTTQQSTA